MIGNQPAAAQAPDDPDDGVTAPPDRPTAAIVLVALCIVLLLVGLWFDGAFSVADWAPLALVVLVALAVLGPGERLSLAAHGFAGGLALFAIWSLVSVLWSDSPSFGIESGARNLLYAGLAGLLVAVVRRRATAVTVAKLLVGSLALLVGGTLLLLAIQGKDLLLAGRLDTPVGYRNGTAAVMAMAAVALLCCAAPRRAQPVWRALAFALAVAALGLGFLTQSRGVVIGFAAGLVVAVALGPDRLRRIWLAIAAVGFVAVAAGKLLTPYDAFIADARTDAGDLQTAVNALVLITAVAFLVMAALALLDNGLRLNGVMGRWLRPLGIAALVILTIGAAGVALNRTGNPVTFVKDKVDEFKTLEPTALGSTRLGSTGGQRYDLWRIAVREFKADPLVGGGEGSFPARYYLERTTDRNLSVAHSLPLAVLGDTGLVGLLLLVGAFGLGALGLLRAWRDLPEEPRRWSSALVASGAVLITQSSIDWLWSIAAPTGLAIALLATGLRVATAPEAANGPATSRSALPVRCIAVVGALGIACLFISATYVGVARDHRDDPARSLSAARTARHFLPFSLEARYLEAGALETNGRTDGAQRVLEDARRLEPRSFVTLALLGDLAFRDRRVARSHVYYRRALALNPNDVGLRALTTAGD